MQRVWMDAQQFISEDIELVDPKNFLSMVISSLLPLCHRIRGIWDQKNGGSFFFFLIGRLRDKGWKIQNWPIL